MKRKSWFKSFRDGFIVGFTAVATYHLMCVINDYVINKD